MDRDRNLLFGVLAVQLKHVSPTQLVEAAALWATDPSRGLPSRLTEAGALSKRECDLIQRLVDDSVEAYDGDAKATLAKFGGEEIVQQSFRGTIVPTPDGGISLTKPAAGKALSEAAAVPGVKEAEGRYTRQSEHARGGMGRVLLVHDEHLGRDIALKELLPELVAASDDTPASPKPSPVRMSVPLLARFLQEARITGQLEHPSIVPVYELGHRSDGTLYYTMKLVRG